MKKKAKASVAPREARTYDEIRQMPRDNVEAGDFWLITDGAIVTLSAQRLGEFPTASISIPRREFDAFVDWYTTGTWTHPSRQKRVWKG